MNKLKRTKSNFSVTNLKVEYNKKKDTTVIVPYKVNEPLNNFHHCVNIIRDPYKSFDLRTKVYSEISKSTNAFLQDSEQYGKIIIREMALPIEEKTIKPINKELLLSQIEKVKYGVVTMENHLINGGIGSIVADIIAENGIAKRLIKLGLNDTFAHGGSKAYLLKYYGLDAYALVKGIEQLMNIKTEINEENLENARIEDVHSLSKAEAL